MKNVITKNTCTWHLKFFIIWFSWALISSVKNVYTAMTIPQYHYVDAFTTLKKKNKQKYFLPLWIMVCDLENLPWRAVICSGVFPSLLWNKHTRDLKFLLYLYHVIVSFILNILLQLYSVELLHSSVKFNWSLWQ